MRRVTSRSSVLMLMTCLVLGESDKKTNNFRDLRVWVLRWQTLAGCYEHELEPRFGSRGWCQSPRDELAKCLALLQSWTTHLPYLDFSCDYLMAYSTSY